MILSEIMINSDQEASITALPNPLIEKARTQKR
jgi:hypothetical protein